MKIFSLQLAQYNTNLSHKSPKIQFPFQILSATSLFSIAFPNQFPSSVKFPKIKVLIIGSVVLISNLLIAGCLSTLIQIKYDFQKIHKQVTHLYCFTFIYSPHQQQSDYQAVPILSILERKDLHKFIAVAACLYVLACTGALLELYPETYNIIVRLATSEWKILVKQISYENRDSGSPILAVFTCGSLLAILAFACPLQNLTYIAAGCQLSAGILRALYFLYSPFRPKSTHHSKQIFFFFITSQTRLLKHKNCGIM